MPESTELQTPYVDRPELIETFADQSRMCVSDGHVVRVELVVARPKLIGPGQSAPTLYPVARLVLTPLAAAQLHEQLGTLVEQFVERGVIKRAMPPNVTKQ